MASWRGGGYISGMFPSSVISISVTVDILGVTAF